MNYASLRSTGYGYRREEDQGVLALDYLGLTKRIKI